MGDDIRTHGYPGERIRQRVPLQPPSAAPPYRFIYDPGHGWLEVTMTELLHLGIAHLISSCSYTTGPRPGGASALVYLEEDCDLGRFADAKGWTARDAYRYWREVHQEHTFIRKLPHFKAPAPPAADPRGPDPHGDLADEAETLRAGYAAGLDPGTGEG